jgi:TRAP-type mannitol/chloroaromatic compound transport system permease small subunit
MSSRNAAVLDVFAYSCGFILFVLLAYSSWPLVWEAWEIKEYEGEGSFHVPTFPVRALILFASVLMSIQFARNIVETVVNKLNLLRKNS